MASETAITSDMDWTVPARSLAVSQSDILYIISLQFANDAIGCLSSVVMPMLPLFASMAADNTSFSLANIKTHATLGKVLESVIAERITHTVETHGLLPTSHFEARK